MGLSEDTFYSLTPAQFVELSDRYYDRREEEDLWHTRIFVKIHNYITSQTKEPQPEDFIHDYRDAMVVRRPSVGRRTIRTANGEMTEAEVKAHLADLKAKGEYLKLKRAGRI